jgi:hypothetical protein
MPIFTAIAVAVSTYVAGITWASVAAFAVRTVLMIGISKLLTNRADGNTQTGASATDSGRSQKVPATNNKLPVVYGTAFMAPVITDAKISTDQKTMWYVCAIAEQTDTGTTSINDIYWAGNLLNFDGTDQTKVVSWTTNAEVPQTDTRVSGNMYVYKYSNGSFSGTNTTRSAIDIMQDAAIPATQRWTSTNLMSNCSFIIVKITYNQDINLQGLAAITMQVNNTLYKPGSVMKDYLTNSRYGCAVHLSSVDVASLDALDAYSDAPITYYNYPYNGSTSTQKRYTINGPINTGNDCLTNLNLLVDSCDSWLQYSELTGQWKVVMNRSYLDYSTTEALYHVTDDQLIGGIDVTPIDLNSGYNSIEIQYPNTHIKDQMDYQLINMYETAPELLSPNEPNNRLTVQYQQVNNAVQALYLGARRLYQGREDLVVNFMLDYSGIQIEAGDVIRVSFSVYGWDGIAFPNGKLFRVSQVQEAKLEDGSLGAKISAFEYNELIYNNDVVQNFVPSPNSGLADPTIISTPAAPAISNIITSSAIPSFVITATTPAIGSITQLEYWYAIAPTISPPTNTSTFKLWETQFYNDGPVFPSATPESTTITGLPESEVGYSYFWRVRAAGAQSKSLFSDNSAPFNWVPTPTATIVGQNFQTSFQPSPITVALYGNGAPDLANVSISLYGLVGATQADYNPTQSNVTMNNSEWRIDNANIIQNGIVIGNPYESTSGLYAVWPTPTSLTANVASITVPIYYKDNTGVVHASPPAVVNINKIITGANGSRGVVTLAYVPVNYNPAVAADSTLSNSFFATTGFSPPIDNDGAVFFNVGTSASSSRKYLSNTWTLSTLLVPGEVITDNSIKDNQITYGTIRGDKIYGNTITGNKIAGQTITGYNLNGNTITGDKIVGNTITGNLIYGNTITGDKITANTITGNLIQANTISAINIVTGTITTNLMTANTINADRITANTISADKLVAHSITSDQILANSITTNSLAANSITSYQLEAFSVTLGKVAAGAITASSIAANTITYENLVIGAVTQARSKTADAATAIIPKYNWPTPPSGYTKPWPDNTRGMVPLGGVTIIPTTDPTSSANLEYTEGSRIEIGFSAKLYSNTFTTQNCIEVWKSGATSYYDRGFNTMRHSYNLTANGSFTTQTIHAQGFGGLDYVSADGGNTWSSFNNSSTSKTITGAINQYIQSPANTLQTTVVGTLQIPDSGGPSSTPTSNWGQRYPMVSLANNPLKYYYTINVGGSYIYTTLYDMSVTPASGGNGISGGTVSTSTGALACGAQGQIYYQSNNGQLTGTGQYNNWVIEDTGGTLQTLYNVYSNAPAVSPKNYTAVAVGQAGTLLLSNRVWGVTDTWTSKSLLLTNGSPILTDLYGVAGNDAVPGSGIWVAVGQYGVLVSSLNDGATWTQRSTPIGTNLRSVRYGNGKWLVVGDNGVVLTSTDAINWTQVMLTDASITTDMLTVNMISIDYSPVWNRFNIGAQGYIFTTSATTILIKCPTGGNIGPTSKYDLQRLAFWGSHPNITDVSIPPVEQQVVNGTIMSGTIVDTQYVMGQETTYYLVLGNMGQSVIWTGQAYLQVTEIKR